MHRVNFILIHKPLKSFQLDIISSRLPCSLYTRRVSIFSCYFVSAMPDRIKSEIQFRFAGLKNESVRMIFDSNVSAQCFFAINYLISYFVFYRIRHSKGIASINFFLFDFFVRWIRKLMSIKFHFLYSLTFQFCSHMYGLTVPITER